MRRLIPILLVIAGVGFLGGGVYMALRGFDAKEEIRAQLVAQKITTPEDASIPNAPVDDAATADAMAKIINVHALEATGGRTYAEMGRFLTPDGGDTSDEAQALKDEEGNPVPNPLRNVAFTAAALQTSLYTARMAFNLADLVIGLGAMVVVLGLAFVGIGITLNGVTRPVTTGRAAAEPRVTPVAA